MKKQRVLLPLLIFAAALFPRLFYIWEIADNPFFTSPVVDAYTYSQQAQVIAAGHWLDFTSGPFWQPPLYSWFLGAVCWFSKAQFFLVARIIQAFWGAASCVLLYLIGRRLLAPGVGLTAAMALAIYGPAIFFDGELLPASLATVLLLGVLLALLSLTNSSAGWRKLVPGLLLGIAALNVAPILIVVPGILLWIYFTERAGGPGKFPFRSVGLFIAGLLLVIAPVTVRNYAIGDDIVLISWNAGVNFFVGNNPDYPATINIRPGQAWLDLIARAQAAGFENGSENSRFFFAEAWRFIRDQPADYARLLGVKFASFWKGDEVGRNQNIYYLRHYSRLLSATLWKRTLAFPFGLVAPLAIAGFLLAIPRGRPVWLVLGVVLSYAAGIILFFVTARYRLPLVPLLLLLAVHAVFWLVENAGWRRPAFFAWSGAILLLGWWTNSHIAPMDMEGDAEGYYNLGCAYVEKKEFPAGIRALEQASRLAPDSADILFNLGTAYALTGDHGRAIRTLSRAARLYPERPDIRFNLGNAYFFRHLYGRAAAEYRAALEAHPDHVETLRSAARATARAGQVEEAITYYERLRHLDPPAIDSFLALGYLYRKTGAPEKSLANYQRALELDPDHLTARLEIGTLHLEKNDLDQALASFQQAARSHPQNPQVHDLVGQVYERQKNRGEAASAYRQVLLLDPNYPDIHRKLSRLYQQEETPVTE